MCYPQQQGWTADDSMAVILWVMGLSLLMQGCLCSLGETDRGCLKWKQSGTNVCCDACHPGNRLVNACGPSPKDLCTPCEPKTYTMNPRNYRCSRCTQCVGAQVLVKECTATTDTQCGCMEGLACGDVRCSFCVKKCGKGEEPTENRSCRPCPPGTFNDQIHQKCKPWSKECPNPDQTGDAFTDVKCVDISVSTVKSNPKPPDNTEDAWPLILSVVICIAVMAFSIIIITIVAIVTRKIHQKRKKTKVIITKTPIIRTPTDDPRTLIAIECSFHEAQQEQGSSSESLASKESSQQLIA